LIKEEKEESYQDSAKIIQGNTKLHENVERRKKKIQNCELKMPLYKNAVIIGLCSDSGGYNIDKENDKKPCCDQKNIIVYG